MNAGDKILLVFAALLGGAAGWLSFGNALGIVFGALAGWAVLGISYWTADEVDSRLRKHYRSI